MMYFQKSNPFIYIKKCAVSVLVSAYWYFLTCMHLLKIAEFEG